MNSRVRNVWIRKKKKMSVSKKDEKWQNCHFTCSIKVQEESMEVEEEFALKNPTQS